MENLHRPHGSLSYTAHALERMQARGFGRTDVEYIVANGERTRSQKGQIVYAISDSPFAELSPDPLRIRNRGRAVVVDAKRRVVTVFPVDQPWLVGKGV